MLNFAKVGGVAAPFAFTAPGPLGLDWYSLHLSVFLERFLLTRTLMGYSRAPRKYIEPRRAPNTTKNQAESRAPIWAESSLEWSPEPSQVEYRVDAWAKPSWASSYAGGRPKLTRAPLALQIFHHLWGEEGWTPIYLGSYS